MDLHLQRQLCDAVWDGDADRVQWLLCQPGIVPHAHHSTALMHAAHRGKLACLHLLLPLSDPNARNAEPLWRAARYNRGSCVRALMPVSDTSGWKDWQCDELPLATQRRLGRTF